MVKKYVLTSTFNQTVKNKRGVFKLMYKNTNHRKKIPHKYKSNRRYKHNPHPKQYHSTQKPNTSQHRRRRRKRKRTRKIILLSILTLLVLAIFFITSYAISFISKFQHEDIDKNDIGISEELFSKDELGITNVALLGVDDNGTSDAIVIVSINTDNKKIKMVSILRDSLVKVQPKNQKSYYSWCRYFVPP